MLTISKKQLSKLEEQIVEVFIDKVAQLLLDMFKNEASGNFENVGTFKLFIKKAIDTAYNYGITKEKSITAFVVLSFLNGEEFLEKKDFTVYKYYLQKRFYNPNDYVFEIPNKKPLN